MRLSDQYRRDNLHTLTPPNNRDGVVGAFDSAFKDEHWTHAQYKEPGPSLADRLSAVSQFDFEQIKAMSDGMKSTANDTVSILDFGAGDGRLSGIYESLGLELAPSKPLRVIALDSSREALNQFAVKLTKAGFQATETETRSDELGAETGYLFGEFKKGLTTIKLVLANVNNSPDQVRELVTDHNDGKKVTTTLSFDTLPFIPKEEDRVGFLRMFRDITEQDLLVTVPGKNNVDKWKEHRAEFDRRRKQGEAVGLATENNTIMYNFRDFYLPYVFYNNHSLASEAEQAGLEGHKVRFNQMRHAQRHQQLPGADNLTGEAALDYIITTTRNKQVDELERDEAAAKKTELTPKAQEALENRRMHIDDFFQDLDGFIQLSHKAA